MCDPVKRPLKWNKRLYVYAERHGLHDVMEALVKELAIWRPEDPLLYIKDEIKRIGRSIYSPKVFMLGPEPLTPLLAEGISNHCGARFFTLRSIIHGTTPDIRMHLQPFLNGEVKDPHQQKLLIATIARRLVGPDCIRNGYVLYGFPQSRAQALMAQASGLIPKQVFVLMPQGPPPINQRRTSVTTNTPTFVDMFAIEKLKLDYTPSQLSLYADYLALNDTITAYNPEKLRIQKFEQWQTQDPHDLEAIFLGVLVTKPNTGSPWIPRIVLFGPPGSGKRTVAQHLAKKYGIMTIGWMDIVRGALAMNDDIADECRMFLHSLTPISDVTVKMLLKRRLYKDEAMKRGFILYGFPETAMQAAMLDRVALTPNRIFYLSCPESKCRERIAMKVKTIMGRKISDKMFTQSIEVGGEENPGGLDPPEEAFDQNPYTDKAIDAKFEYYSANFQGVIRHFGSSAIYVDAMEDLNVTVGFVTSCVTRPPNIRFD